jgi:site-specific recombinase XerD
MRAVQDPRLDVSSSQFLSPLVLREPGSRALNHALPDRIKAIRASKKINVPVVMTREEVAAVLALMDGTIQLVAKRLYGSGLRIMEAVRLPYPAMDKRTALANVVAANSSNRQHIPPSA